MVLAGRNLFVAGPPDILNEEESYQRFHEPEMQKQLEEQEKAWVGRKGAVLLTYSARTGTALSRRTLGAPPVWDGMVAAGGRLYMCLTDGRVVCYDGTPERQ